MATYFKIVAAALLSACILACSEKTNPIDAALPPGTFNLSTVITDSEGNSLDLAGDWAVFTDPDETRFTNYLHFEQDRQLTYSVLDNQIYMVDVDQGKRSLPVYDNGLVSEPRNVFLFHNIKLNNKIKNNVSICLINISRIILVSLNNN